MDLFNNHKTSLLQKKWSIQINETLPLADLTRNINHLRGTAEPPLLRTLMPDPDTIPGLRKSLARLLSGLKNNEKIGIFGDYDVDGAASTALIFHYLKAIDHPIKNFIIPCRINEGYGPKNNHFDIFAEQGVSLVLMVDCGTAAHDVLLYAKTLHIDVIVLDHHTPPQDAPLPSFCVNPHLSKDPALHMLCAAGVCFLFLVALQRALRKRKQYRKLPDLLTYLGIVSLATVCDVVPMQGLNRALVTHGLQNLTHPQFPGMLALTEMFPNLTESSMGFTAGPLLNAGSRMGHHRLAAELLTSETLEQAHLIAQQLSDLNHQRKESTENALITAYHLAAHQENQNFILLSHPDWSPGIIGLLAARIADRYYKPTLVIAEKHPVSKGACRNPIPSFYIAHILHKSVQENIALSGGGHQAAAGFSIEPKNIPTLKNFLTHHTPSPQNDPILNITTTLPLHTSLETINESMQSLRPFGHKNRAPLFLVKNTSCHSIKNTGKKHISFSIVYHNLVFSCTAFGNPESPLIQAIKSHTTLHFAVSLNQYKQFFSLIIEDAMVP